MVELNWEYWCISGVLVVDVALRFAGNESEGNSCEVEDILDCSVVDLLFNKSFFMVFNFDLNDDLVFCK